MNQPRTHAPRAPSGSPKVAHAIFSRHRTAVVLLPSLWIAIGVGCGRAGRDATRNSPVVEDSGGVRIVVSPAATSRGSGDWLVATVPSLSIGTVDGAADYQLSDVRGVVVLSNRRIVVADAGASELRCYAPDGRFLWKSGRRGNGPGEFVRLARMMRYRGDSLLVYDFTVGRRRFSVFGPSGQFARTWEARSPESWLTSLWFAGAWDDGTVAMGAARSARTASPPRVVRLPSTLLRFDADGDGVRSMGDFPGTEYFEGEAFAVRRLPWARTSLFAPLGSRTVVGTNDTYEIRILGPSGALETIIRRRSPPTLIDPTAERAERERLRDARRAERAVGLRGMPDSLFAVISASEEKLFSEIPFPPSYPAYDALLVDRGGDLWVKDVDPTADTDSSHTRWTVFAPDGRVYGVVVLPERFTPYDADRERVIGVQTDVMGVNFVRAYALARARHRD